MENFRRQEIYCHNCGRYVQFDVDVNLDGMHVLNCPNCNHEHCRIVENGVVTEARWDSRNYQNTMTYMVTGSITTTAYATYDTCASSTDTATSTGMTTGCYGLWMDTQRGTK